MTKERVDLLVGFVGSEAKSCGVGLGYAIRFSLRGGGGARWG